MDCACSLPPNQVAIETVLSWFKGSAGVMPDLVLLYLSEIDSKGHRGGPDSVLVSALDIHSTLSV